MLRRNTCLERDIISAIFFSRRHGASRRLDERTGFSAAFAIFSPLQNTHHYGDAAITSQSLHRGDAERGRQVATLKPTAHLLKCHHFSREAVLPSSLASTASTHTVATIYRSSFHDTPIS